MGYYKDLRVAIGREGDLGNPKSEDYKLVMEAKKPLLDLLFYQREEDWTGEGKIEINHYIDEQTLSRIGFRGTPELVEKVYHQIKKYKSRLFYDKKYRAKFYKEGYLSCMTFGFRTALYEKCNILWFMEDDFTYEAYVYAFGDSWKNPWEWLSMKYGFYRKYLVEYSKRTGEGFYEKTLHNPEKLIKDLETIPESYELEETKDAIRKCILEASKYVK